MNRNEAVDLLKEILDKCINITQYGIAIMPPNSDDVLSKYFQIHVFGNINKLDTSCLKSIMEKSCLQLKLLQEKNLLVIYRPMKPESDC